MSKSKRRGARSVVSETTSDSPAPKSESAPHEISARLRKIVSLILIVHWCALLFALSANLAPSYLQGNVMRWLSGYLVTTNQEYGALPLELTHAEPLDFPLIIEAHRRGDPAAEWRRLALPGVAPSPSIPLALNQSRWANFGRIICMVAMDQPEDVVLSDIAAQALTVAESTGSDEHDAIRFLIPAVLSYDEDIMRENGQLTADAEELQPEIVYSASVVREPNGNIQLVPSQESLRTSKPAEVAP